MSTPNYCGRFAPSPTGPLHAGSLLAALASFLDARAAGGKWLLRIDDIDPPRAIEGSIEWIQRSLKAHGLHWDGGVVFQSTHAEKYENALKQLDERGYLFACTCTRTTLGERGCCVLDCAEHPKDRTKPHSLRIRIPADTAITFTDRFLGLQQERLGEQLNNFIVRRRDGLFAYQLAAAVDDGNGLINQVVRGEDLLPSTARQIFIQGLLELPSPDYAHVPVVCDDQGVKLSKQTGAPGLDNGKAAANLREALSRLNQLSPPSSYLSPEHILAWAIEHWHFPNELS